eukprot:jgi/Bigna1/147657/aug1.322_g22365
MRSCVSKEPLEDSDSRGVAEGGDGEVMAAMEGPTTMEEIVVGMGETVGLTAMVQPLEEVGTMVPVEKAEEIFPTAESMVAEEEGEEDMQHKTCMKEATIALADEDEERERETTVEEEEGEGEGEGEAAEVMGRRTVTMVQ